MSVLRNLWHADTTTGDESSSDCFRLTKGRSVCSRCFKPQVTHGSEQIGLLQRLRERRREECTRFAHVGATVSADGYNGRARIFVVGAFDIPRGALAID